MWKSLWLAAAACVLVAPVAQSAPLTIGGRVRVDHPAKDQTVYRYQWPAVYFEARFAGNKVGLRFDDPSNNFNVIIDDHTVMLLRKPGTKTVWLDGLGKGEHTIRLEKRSETQYAVGGFAGFVLPAGQKFLSAPVRARQIEFIGDSYTVGYGNTSAFTQCTPDEIFETTDSQQGFGPLTAKHFNADYQVNAFSGLGMVRNYDGHEHPKYHMPMLYPRAVFDDPAAAVQTGWHPQIVVIGIGGNDFSTPLHDDEPWKTRDALRADYKATFVKFVQDVRARNPQAFILIDSPDTDRAEYHDAVTEVVDALKAAGETRIAELILPHTDNNGCNGHPNIHDDQKVSTMLTAYIEAHPEVWQGK